jgi:ABC-2 type transport system permease protein
MSAIYVLWLRELRRFVRSKLQIITTLVQPTLYLVVLGLGMGAVFRQAGRGSYVQFIAPGIIAMTVLFAATFSGITLLFDRQFGFLKETLVAPVPRAYIMLGRTTGAATVAFLQGMLVAVVCFVAGFRPVQPALLPIAAVYVALIALAFAALGATFGATLRDMQSFQMVMNFVIMPLFFLSGGLYPLDQLPSVLAVLTQLNPLSYGVDGMRSMLLQESHFSAVIDAAVLATLALVLLCVGAWRFSKIET